MNHAAWIIGHLAYSSQFLATLFGADQTSTPGYAELFGMSSKPTDDPTRYPSKQQLLQALEAAHELSLQAMAKADDSVLQQPNPVEPLAKAAPTVGDLAVMLMTMHEGVHIGQLSAWRRAQGMPAVSPF